MNRESLSGRRVVCVLPDLGAGGAQTVAVWLLDRLSRLGADCAVVQAADAPATFHRLDPSIQVMALRAPASRWPGILRAAIRVARLRRRLRILRPDIVLSMVGATNVTAILASVGQPWRLVISERNDPTRQRLEAPWDFLRRKLYRYADVMTANTTGAVETLRAWAPGTPACLVPNAVARPTERVPVEEGEPAVITVGRLHKQKAQDVLLRAWLELAAEFPQWRLVIVGDGELRDELRALAETLDIGDRVVWRGRVSDVPAELRAASVFALPSRYEGTPNALLEAMAHGLPSVVADASPGPLECVIDERTGLVVPVDDVSALARALGRLMRDPALRAHMGAAARTRAEDHDPEEVLAQWVAVLAGDGPEHCPQ